MVTVAKEADEEDFADEHDIIICDSQMPLAFSKDRHHEKIEGSKIMTQTWRMKERVCAFIFVLEQEKWTE